VSAATVNVNACAHRRQLARQHGVYSVAHPLRLAYMGLKKRLGEPSSHRRKAPRPAFVELIKSR